MLVHPTSTAASKGNRILHILEAPADVVEVSTTDVVGELDVGAAEVAAASMVEVDVTAPDMEMGKTDKDSGVSKQLSTFPTLFVLRIQLS